MVTTRLQSGVLPARAVLVTGSAPDLTSESDSGSDYFEAKRPSKRARLVATGKGEKGGKGGKGSTQKGKGHDLSILSSITFDILFEIFGHLSPSDLLNLTRTNKGLRQFLLSRQVTSIWKKARHRVPKAPKCPPDVSEPRWANLIFGGSFCHVCGAKGVQKVNFWLRRRVCSGCLKLDLVYAGDFARKFPDYDIAVLDLLPYSQTSGWWQYSHPKNSRFYWKPDVYQMVKTLGGYTQSVHMEKPGAEQALEDFKAVRIQIVGNIMQHARRYRHWNDDVAQERTEGIKNRKQKRRDQITERFVQLGYLKKDIDFIAGAGEVEVEKELTERIWKRIRPILEPIVITARQARVAAERQRLIHSRMSTVEKVYLRYKKALLPSQWASFPPFDEAIKEEEFSKLINEDSNRKIAANDCSAALRRLPEFVAAWNDQKTQMLLALISSANSGNAPNSLPFNPVDPMCDDVLELPTSVFVCDNDTCKPRNTPIIGRDCLLSHECTDLFGCNMSQRPQLAFSQRGSMAVVQIIALVGLQAGIVDLDDQDLRFACEGSTSDCIQEHRGRIGHTWRQAVLHFIRSSVATHPEPYFRILTPTETIVIKSKEGPDPSFVKKCWICNRCSKYFDDWGTRATVIDHLATVHDVREPEERSDFFHHPGINRRQRKIGFICKTDKTYICLMCPEPSNRLFVSSGVKSHLRDRHKVLQPVQGQDWQKLENSPLLVPLSSCT